MSKIIKVESCGSCPFEELYQAGFGCIEWNRCTHPENKNEDVSHYVYAGGVHPECPLKDEEDQPRFCVVLVYGSTEVLVEDFYTLEQAQERYETSSSIAFEKYLCSIMRVEKR